MIGKKNERKRKGKRSVSICRSCRGENLLTRDQFKERRIIWIIMGGDIRSRELIVVRYYPKQVSQ